MAHTDTHRPWWVQLNDPTIRSKTITIYSGHTGDRHPIKNFTCGCAMCTGRHWRRQRRRQERAFNRALTRTLLATRFVDLDDVPTPPPNRVLLSTSW